ncbi:MAG: hypothetical protein J7598_10705 [Mitsuaria chitosanitabida]|uniref:hypothetical protein n=1 Tax=Roseateles chitosanitabidus TaxID=65048 RepID=UPI001B2CF886|nr:hypothetical protein [Roseateles chitosanitabidus]MBO9687075.1 hypothetical protein [Roseateles chitosanitabidus]
MDKWDADIDVEVLPNGKYVPVLVIIPPVSVGPPLRRRLEGEYEHEELARMAVLDAMVAMTHESPSQ